MARDDDSVRRAVSAYDDALEKYIPVLMQQAKIYWDRENYGQVEKIFRCALLLQTLPYATHISVPGN